MHLILEYEIAFLRKGKQQEHFTLYLPAPRPVREDITHFFDHLIGILMRKHTKKQKNKFKAKKIGKIVDSAILRL